jgi:hypothetical protein
MVPPSSMRLELILPGDGLQFPTDPSVTQYQSFYQFPNPRSPKGYKELAVQPPNCADTRGKDRFRC